METKPAGVLPDPEVTPTVNVYTVAAALGMSRDGVYDAANRGELPSVRVGRRVLFPTAEIRRLVGLDNQGPS